MNLVGKMLNKISGGKILDVGTGTGYFTQFLSETVHDYIEIVGIDSSEKSIKMAKESFKENNKINFYKMDAEKIDFKDNSFDTVCISNTLHHLPNIKLVLNEMMRVLKPGGLFIINEMFCDNQSEKQMSHVYIHHLCGEIDTLLGTYHRKTYKKQEIINIAKDLGIKIEEVLEYDTAEEQEKDASPEEEKEVLDSVFKSIDKYLEKIKDLPQYEKKKAYVFELKKKLYSIGFLNSTELIIVGKKK